MSGDKMDRITFNSETNEVNFFGLMYESGIYFFYRCFI